MPTSYCKMAHKKFILPGAYRFSVGLGLFQNETKLIENI